MQRVHFKFGSLNLKNSGGERPSKDYYSTLLRNKKTCLDLHHANNFTQVTATKDKVIVEFIRGRDGKILDIVDICF